MSRRDERLNRDRADSPGGEENPGQVPRKPRAGALGWFVLPLQGENQMWDNGNRGAWVGASERGSLFNRGLYFSLRPGSRADESPCRWIFAE
jgi:hypothetical protein